MTLTFAHVYGLLLALWPARLLLYRLEWRLLSPTERTRRRVEFVLGPVVAGALALGLALMLVLLGRDHPAFLSFLATPADPWVAALVLAVVALYLAMFGLRLAQTARRGRRRGGPAALPPHPAGPDREVREV